MAKVILLAKSATEPAAVTIRNQLTTAGIAFEEMRLNQLSNRDLPSTNDPTDTYESAQMKAILWEILTRVRSIT